MIGLENRRNMRFIATIFAWSLALNGVMAQTDTLAPKWVKGQSWKVTSKSYVPDTDLLKEEQILVYDTLLIDYNWKVEDISDSVVTLSIMPLTFYSSSEEIGLNTAFLKEAFEKIKTENTPLLYQTDLKGKLKRKVSEDENLFSDKYFINDTVFERLFPMKDYQEEDEPAIFWDEENDVLSDTNVVEVTDTIEEETEEVYEVEDDFNLGFWVVLSTFTKIIDYKHAMYGEPLVLDSLMSYDEAIGEKLESYQKGLGAMAAMMDIKGNYKFVQKDNQLICDYELKMDMANFIKSMVDAFKDLDSEKPEKKLSKKEKKELEEKEKKQMEEMSQVSMIITLNSHLVLDKVTYLPIFISNKANSAGGYKEEAIDMSAFHELIFE